MNVKRTVRGYARAGFAGNEEACCCTFPLITPSGVRLIIGLLPRSLTGILIEDQVAPKSCGHVRGKRVVGREEAVSRIRAAVDAR